MHEPDTSGIAPSMQTIVPYYAELLGHLQRLLAVVSVHVPLIASWAGGPHVVGEAVKPRMAALGIECVCEMLWW